MNKEPEIIVDTAKELEAIKDRKVCMTLTPSECLPLIGTIQLALRHPKMKEFPEREHNLRLIITMASAAFHDCPACQEMIKLGWQE